MEEPDRAIIDDSPTPCARSTPRQRLYAAGIALVGYVGYSIATTSFERTPRHDPRARSHVWELTNLSRHELLVCQRPMHAALPAAVVWTQPTRQLLERQLLRHSAVVLGDAQNLAAMTTLSFEDEERTGLARYWVMLRVMLTAATWQFAVERPGGVEAFVERIAPHTRQGAAVMRGGEDNATGPSYTPSSYLLHPAATCWHVRASCSAAEAARHAAAYVKRRPIFDLAANNCERFVCHMVRQCGAPRAAQSCDVERCTRKLMFGDGYKASATTRPLRRAPGCGLVPLAANHTTKRAAEGKATRRTRRHKHTKARTQRGRREPEPSHA